MLKTPFKRYNIAAPRYTSYPTVPYWDTQQWSASAWLKTIRQTAAKHPEGISLYIHLPFCETLCTYCGCNTHITKNHQVEEPYLEAVWKEWQLYKAHLPHPIQINDLHLGGGTPTFFSAENLSSFITRLLQDVTVVSGAEFSFEAHPANTTTDHLEVLYHLGFRRLSLGIQDFNTDVQRIINRRQSPADVIRVMQEARKIGYTSINFDLIYGLPRQNLTRIRETLSMTLAMKPDRIAFYSYAHVPWMKPGQRLFTESDLPNDEEKFEFYYEGKKMIKEAGYMDIGMDHFAFPTDSLAMATTEGKIYRNFMGYTDRPSQLLIGLGVSAISDGVEAYAQNVKNTEEYKQLINQGTLALQRGHLLTDEDLLIREQIQAIMCTHKLDIREYPLSENTRKRLAPLIKDAMVKLNAHELEVTTLGRSFLRNICMAFDERYAQGKKDETLFSKAI